MKKGIAPAVIVVLIGLTGAVTGALGQGVQVQVSEDGPVYSSSPTRNYKGSVDLVAGVAGAYSYRAYMKFGLSALEGQKVTNATLVVWYKFGSPDTTPRIGVFSAPDNWTEATLTWNSAPAIDGGPYDTVALGEGYVAYRLNVTDIVGKKAESGAVTLVLAAPDSGGNGGWGRFFGLGQIPAHPATLEIQAQPAETPDVTPPTMELKALKASLWPPNHEMQLCATLSNVADDRTKPEDVKVSISVTSDEAVNSQGDGNTDPDWEVVPKGDVWEVWLRAERAGSGDGRVYSIAVSAVDKAGNEAKASSTVTVAHDQGKSPGK